MKKSANGWLVIGAVMFGCGGTDSDEVLDAGLFPDGGSFLDAGASIDAPIDDGRALELDAWQLDAPMVDSSVDARAVDAPASRDAMLPDADASLERIVSIAATGPIELVWDWELYRDPEAQRFDNIQGLANTFDAPIHFFKDANDAVFSIASMPVNYRVPFTSSFEPARALRASDRMFDSSLTYPADNGRFLHVGYGSSMLSGSCVEADYDNRMWIFGLWTDDGVNFSALAHHEFYPLTCPNSTTAAWVNGVHHLLSSDGGATFRPQAYLPYAISGMSNARRMVLVPEPWAHAAVQGRATYGFFHPSNIVREGDYVYALVQARFYTGPGTEGDGVHEGGFAMIRALDPRSPEGWEVHTSGGWRVIARGTFHGRRGQEVSLFLSREGLNPYASPPAGGQGLTKSLVQHETTGQWIAFGVSHEGGGSPVRYSVSDSLESPRWSETDTVRDSPVLLSGQYPSLIDHESAGRVFQFVDETAYIYFVARGNHTLVEGVGALPPSNVLSRSVFRFPVEIRTDLGPREP